VFLSEQCAVLKVTTSVEVQTFSLDRGPQSFCCTFIALSITRCSKSAPKICFWGVSSHYCCYGNHAAGSKPI